MAGWNEDTKGKREDAIRQAQAQAVEEFRKCKTQEQVSAWHLKWVMAIGSDAVRVIKQSSTK